MTTQTAVASTTRDRLIGTNADGDRVYISMEIRHHGPQFTTTGEPVYKRTRDHRTITEYDELSISGCEVEAGLRNAHSFGQIRTHLNADDITNPTIPADMVRDLFDLWNRCHLNGMHANCVHQDNVPTTSQYWKHDAQEQTLRCPEGYKYGSAWLVECLTEQDIDRAREIIAALETQPAYTGN